MDGVWPCYFKALEVAIKSNIALVYVRIAMYVPYKMVKR